jgi:hypothetical protein
LRTFRIRGFFIPVDFVVLEMHLDLKVSLILGRPFLSTTNAHIDIGIGEVKFNINRREERFPFRPRPELNLKANMISEEGDDQSSRTSSSGQDDTFEE